MESNLTANHKSRTGEAALIWFIAVVFFFYVLWLGTRLDIEIIFVLFIALLIAALLLILYWKAVSQWMKVFHLCNIAGILHCLYVMSSFTNNYYSDRVTVGYQDFFLPLVFISVFIFFRIKWLSLKAMPSRKGGYMISTDNFGIPDFDTFILAVVATNILYIIFRILSSSKPNVQSWAGFLIEKFTERGIIPVITVCLFFWAIIILAMKVNRFLNERKSEHIVFNAFPELRYGKIPDKEKITKLLSTELGNYTSCVFSKRLLLLSRYGYGSGNTSHPSVKDMFTSQGEYERNLITSSHTAMRFIIWAIPVLGFLGTVWGISLSVSELTTVLSDSAKAHVSNIGSPLPGFGTALQGLGVAFDTTLVALSLSVIAMLFSSYIRKMEEDLVSKADLMGSAYKMAE